MAYRRFLSRNGTPLVGHSLMDHIMFRHRMRQAARDGWRLPRRHLRRFERNMRFAERRMAAKERAG